MNKQDKDIQFVPSEQVFKSFYEESIVDVIYLRYYQISYYPNSDGNHSIRSLLFKGIKNNGISFYDYHIINEKIHLLPKEQLDHLIAGINDQKFKSRKQTNDVKVVYKFYPVVDIKLQDYPLGDDLHQCASQLCEP